jgi:hypothetical protein
MKIVLIIFFLFINFGINAFPIPKDNKVTFDIIRKNKIIGSVETNFLKEDNNLIIDTIVNIKVKVFFFPAYKFFQQSKEIWKNGEFIEFEGYSDFEVEREYYIYG